MTDTSLDHRSEEDLAAEAQDAVAPEHPAAPSQERIDSYPTDVVAGFPVRPGRPLPFGATVVPDGINFSVYANAATEMTLLIFRRGEATPTAEIPIPASFRIGGCYAITVLGLDAEEIEYAYRADGPFDPEQGHWFDKDKILSDPYARLLGGRDDWGGPAADESYRFRARVGYDDFDWEGDHALNRGLGDLVVYELHVRGFTRSPSSGVVAPGTFAGLVEKIPYLKALGINCVELMPVFEFDERENWLDDPEAENVRCNYWGYSPLGFFAPKASYAVSAGAGMQMDEFKNMVKELHKAGIEVILDVVFNHTGEGNEQGPYVSFRGLDNKTYYLLGPSGEYTNYSGTGNTLNCNHPVTRGFVLDCLRYWVSEYHVDGFRFDLAAILGRAQDGSLLANPPLLESLAFDPVLRDTKLVAEAWDAGGLYQVGQFADYQRWSEWNGRYRDTVRKFVKGDEGVVGEMATRLAGSSDLYAGRGGTASVNFVTAHDGFTMADLVAYDDKHNEANGENNSDGDNNGNTWNCGAEGPTDDPEVLALRARQIRNLMTLLLVSRGVPMFVAGDEIGRTQQGNNNAYCLDGPLTWFDWTLAEKNADLFRFTSALVGQRGAHPALRPGPDGVAEPPDRVFPSISWHGARAWEADWSPGARLIAPMFYAWDPDHGHDVVYLAANAWWEALDVELPALPDGLRWHVAADTAAASPADAYDPGSEPPVGGPAVHLEPRSAVVLVARPGAAGDATP